MIALINSVKTRPSLGTGKKKKKNLRFAVNCSLAHSLIRILLSIKLLFA